MELIIHVCTFCGQMFQREKERKKKDSVSSFFFFPFFLKPSSFSPGGLHRLETDKKKEKIHFCICAASKADVFTVFQRHTFSIQFPPRVCMLDQSVYPEKAPPPILRHTMKSHVDVTITDLIVCLWFFSFVFLAQINK